MTVLPPDLRPRKRVAAVSSAAARQDEQKDPGEESTSAMIVVDSSVWIANLRDLDTKAVRLLRSIEDPDDILIGDLILLELLQGARSEADLRQFRIERMLDEELAVLGSRHYRTLRDKGVTIRKTIDLIIGTFCLARGHFLLHDDRDLDSMALQLGLRVIQPVSGPPQSRKTSRPSGVPA